MIECAKWIACPENAEVPIIERRFRLTKPVSGSMEITGLGYFTLHINGKRIGNDLFTPALTDYEYRDRSRWRYPIFDEGQHRIYYLKYDISDALRDGENRIQIRLGPGFYRQNERVNEGNTSFGQMLKALYACAITDAEGEHILLSDGSETWHPSEIVYSNMFIGEIHDAHLRNGVSENAAVQVVEAPQTRLMMQTCMPDRVQRSIVPVCIAEKEGKRVYDIGINTTFMVSVSAAGEGNRVVLRYAEEIDDQKQIDPHSAGAHNVTVNKRPQIQSDTFICTDGECEFTTEFVWHAARYIETEGEFSSLRVDVVHTDVKVTSEFECSEPVLNWLYHAYINSQLTNLHGCIPSDCPHRERLGYTGDGQACAKSAMLTLDMKEAYRKWIYDILDCQDITGGHVQHTAPHMGGGGGPGGWGCAMVIMPDEYDRHYGDEALLRECYPHMKAWIAYLRNHSEGELVVKEEPHGWCLGDWAALYPVRIPIPFVNTCYLLNALERIANIADRLGYAEDKTAYEHYAQRVRRALRETYYDEATGSFCGEVNGADAFALWVHIEKDERTLRNLVKRYSERLDYFDTGFLGTEILISELMKHGYADVALRLLKTEKMGGYAYMMRQGATTIWETFDGNASHNHPMFGSPVMHFFDGLLGIGQAEDSRGYRKLVIQPRIPKEMKFARGACQFPCGKVAVKWAHEGKKINLSVCVPEGTAAELIWNGKAYTLLGDNSFVLNANE